MFFLLFFSYVSVAVYFVTNRKDLLKSYYLKHSLLALIGILIVHFQMYTDYVLGNISSDNYFIWVDEKVVVKGLLFSAIGLVCFLLGLSVYGDKIKLPKKNKVESKPISTAIMVILAWASLILFFATVNPLYLAGFYGTEDMGVTATYASLVLELLLFAIILQNSRNMILNNDIPSNFKGYVVKQGYLLLGVLSLYLLGIVLSGDRGSIITFGLCYISGYFFVTRKKVSFKSILIFIFIGASFITLLGEARNMEKNINFLDKVSMIMDKEKSREEETSIIPQTRELAGSVRALHLTLNYIPEKHEFLYGRFQFQQVLTCIPFIGIFNPIIYDDLHIKYFGSAYFVTWINQGDKPTSGDGTSCVADFYFDFGLIGIIVGMFFFGYFMRYCELQLYMVKIPSLFTHVLIIVYLCQAIYIARSSVLFELKTVVWVFLVLVFNKNVLNKIYK